jgi:hypothetical protein
VIRETGETHRSEGSGLDADLGRRLRWESDGDIVLMKPGNSGGGKDPDFWSAFDDGEDRVIGDEPATPEKIRIFQRKLYRKAKADETPCRVIRWRGIQCR